MVNIFFVGISLVLIASILYYDSILKKEKRTFSDVSRKFPLFLGTRVLGVVDISGNSSHTIII